MQDVMIRTVLSALLSVINEAIPEVGLPEELQEYSDRVADSKNTIFGSYVPVLKRDNLQSIFNILNGNQSNKHYRPVPINVKGDCNYPTDESCVCDYSALAERINRELVGLEYSETWLNSFIEFLETETSYIPGTLSDPDISLFDQAKVCAAVAACLQRQESVSNPPENMFLLYSMDFSGIQDFIYTINSKGALKTLRARSFYLDILMDNCVDHLLWNLELTRVNLIYSGGGHSYLLIPHNDSVLESIDYYNYTVNNWLLNTYDISLYVGHGFAPCSGEMLRNNPEGSYKDIFRAVSKSISARKANRYIAPQLLRLNNRASDDYSRECKVCRRVDKLISDECSICNSIKNLSKGILKDKYFAVLRHSEEGVPLPFDMKLVSFADYKSLEAVSNEDVVRIYRKRQADDPSHKTVGLWIGDYASERTTLEEMAVDAKNAGRIERIGVIRADVDNLGTTFASGFDQHDGGNLMRTTALSRQLSLFFKNHINYILGHKNPNVTICYSGGDDMFIIGEWYDLLESSIDIREAFELYTEGTLSISGGIGIYDSKYPISRIAYETAAMEDQSKLLPGKDALTLFESHTYHWSEYEDKVVGEKLRMIEDFFNTTSSRGNSFLYKLLELIRNQTERINFARYVYLLSRLEPGHGAPHEEKDSYRTFSGNMTKWIKTEEDRKQLITAIQLYVYKTRNKEE